MDKTKQIEKMLAKYDIDDYHWKSEIAKDIAALYEGWVPPEFVEWKDFETDPVTNADNNTHSHIYQGGIYSLDALFQYWETNVRDK